MLKKIIVSACVAGIGIFISCSDLNDSSTLGGKIVTNSDPTLTDFDENFEHFDTLSVLEQYSVAEPADTVIGNGIALVGKNSTKIVRGIFGFNHDTTIRFKNYRRTLKSVTVEISADSVKRDSVIRVGLSSMSVYAYQPGNLTTELNNSATKLFNNNKIFKDTLTAATVASIDSTLKSYFTRDTTRDSTGKRKNTVELLKLMVASDDTIFVLKNEPKLILSYDSSGKTIIDTLISKFSSNIQFDGSAAKTAFDPIPVSSAYNGRYAVFKIDLKSLWADMAKRPGFTTILSVPLVISGQPVAVTASGVKLVTTDTIEKQYYYYISPRLFSNPKSIKDSMSFRSVNGRIGSNRYLDTVAAEIYFRPLSNSKPDAAYLYLRNFELANSVSDRSIRWSNPVITGVFTNNQ